MARILGFPQRNFVRDDFDGIVGRYQGMVYSIAYHALGDQARAEELAQDVFLSLYEQAARIQDESHLKNWLRRVTSTRCIDESRRLKFRSKLALEDLPEPAVVAETPDPALQGEVQRALLTLKPDARAVVVLRYQEELEPAQISELLGIPLATVKSRLFRALGAMRECLEQAGIRNFAGAGRES